MATDLITRTGKGAALSASNHDQNIESGSGAVTAKTDDYTILYTDQNATIEFTKATAVTANLSAVATVIAAIDTTKFRVTIKNLGAGICTIDPNGAETIDGAASVALLTNESAEVQINAAGTGWNVIKSVGAMLSWTQTLSNKTLTAPVIATLSPDGVETITLPVATDTLVGKATTDTLTNKTLASGNTVASGLTWSAAQNFNSQGMSNVNISSGLLAGVTVNGTLTWNGGQVFSNGTTTIATADINSGNIDGTTIGASTPAAATLSSLSLSTDLAVTHGGTGASTLGNHWVLVGSGTGAITPVSPSTAGLVLMSRGTSLDPSFQSVPEDSDFADGVEITNVGETTFTWNTGFGTNNFVWGITGVRRTDTFGFTNMIVRGRDGTGFEGQMEIDTGASDPGRPTAPSTGIINFTYNTTTSASYQFRLWARKLI